MSLSLRSAARTGASAELVREAGMGLVQFLASTAVMIEYEAVCTRTEHVEASGLTRTQMRVFLDAIASLCEPVRTHFLWRPQLRDPSDEMVLETAINGRADAIVSFNVADYGIAVDRFGVEILGPYETLKRIRE